MKVSLHTEELRLRHTFTIARGSEDASTVVVLELERDGITGLGEARPTGYYGQSEGAVMRAVESLAPWLRGADPLPYRHLLAEAEARLGDDRAALCALDLAVHDWVGKKLGLPLHRLLGLDPERLPLTSFTIGIDALERMVEKLRLAAGHSVIKIKLGTPDDVEIVRALRRETRATLRVDANCAWGPREAIEKSQELAALGVELIEQPLPPTELDAMEEVRAKSALPLIADENSVVPSDVPRLAGRFDGINVKLVKCGGILPALRMVETARALGLRIMFGCMIESSITATAAAQIGALADYLDLDSPLLITNDPYRGVLYEGGRLRLPAGPGLGVARR
jgi:L-alanine-DL-glutamate epimerase-like enolase superfamily enzyme